MTQVTNDDVQRLAQLSSLMLKDDEATHLRADIENILTYIDELGKLDTTGVEPTYQVTELENVWRNDEVDHGGVSADTLLGLAVEQADHQIKIPKVL